MSYNYDESLIKRLNDLDEPISLADLFAAADAIGDKSLSQEEIDTRILELALVMAITANK
jgi:hypothetical protein